MPQVVRRLSDSDQGAAPVSEDLFPRIPRAQRDCARAGVVPLGFGERGLSFVFALFCLRKAGKLLGERERDTHSQAVFNSPRSTGSVEGEERLKLRLQEKLLDAIKKLKDQEAGRIGVFGGW